MLRPWSELGPPPFLAQVKFGACAIPASASTKRTAQPPSKRGKQCHFLLRQGCLESQDDFLLIPLRAGEILGVRMVALDLIAINNPSCSVSDAATLCRSSGFCELNPRPPRPTGA